MATNLPLLDISLVKDECPDLELIGVSDSNIQRKIDYIDAEYGVCLNNTYGDSRGSELASHAICIMITDANGGNFPIKSETAANGSSTTYDTTRIKQDSRNYIDKYDTAQCLSGLVAPDIGLFTFNGGATRDEIAESQGIFNGIIR